MTMNRPTLFSIILKAEGDRTVYAGMNLDVTGGKVLEDQDLLYTNSTEYASISREKLRVRRRGDPGGFPAGRALGHHHPLYETAEGHQRAEGARLLTSYKLDSNGEDMTLDLKPGELVPCTWMPTPPAATSG